MKLAYDAADFPLISRKAIANGDVFTFDITGVTWEKLQPHVVAEELRDWARFAADPDLRCLTVIMALAQVSNRAVRIVSFGSFGRVQVGSTH
jgi:hypothetical protein